MKKQTGGISRRGFLQGAAAAGAATLVPRHVLGGPGRTPPSDTLTAGLIGCGGQGGEDLRTYIDGAGGKYKLVAACDVDKRRLANAKRKFGQHVALYTDWRRLLERKDIDVVSVATPPHWHALMCIGAAQAGKDILCEKPMTRFIAEGRAVVDAVKRYNRVFQIGTGGRFGAYRSPFSRTIHKIMRSGLLKKCPAVWIKVGGFPVKAYCGKVNARPQPAPAHLDWDMYCGPSPLRPYHPHRFGWSHRYYWDYEGGSLADFAQHYMDPFQWIYGKDDTSPVGIEAYAPPAHPEACGLWAWVELTYADGLTLVLDGKEWGPRYDRKQARHVRLSDLDEDSRKKVEAMPDPEPLLKFPQAVKERKPSGGHVEAAHRAVTIAHLANIAIRVGRRIKYDPVKEQILGDEAANRLVYQPMREPWHL
jgi:myo-inositol 2-dehydrogenase/D-chiro-inositol 1-dehydrogenase